MRSVLWRELKINAKLWLIWSLAVGGMGLACILLYQNMEGEMKEMADMFSNMGAFSDAFGMSTLSIATLEGFFATEVGTVHGLGSGMFAAILAIGILSKEEERHTGEFLLALPVSRSRVVAAKGLCVLVMLLLFTLVCGLMYAAGILYLKDDFPMADLFAFLWRQLIMNAEIAGMCFLVSAISTRIKTGLGLGIAMIFYMYDVIGRVVPDLSDYLFVGPYSYANASEIFSGEELPAKALVLGIALILACTASSFLCYGRRDIVS